MNSRNRSARRIALGALAAGALAAGVIGATSASATDIKVGYGKINYDGLAVGTDIDPVTGVAADNATFTWDLTNGVTKLNVDGRFAVIDRSGVPVRLDLYYYTGLSASGPVYSSHHTTGFTPASDALVNRNLDWTPPGAIGVQSAKLCVASDADRDGNYLDERCITSSL
jgi:hypothetical protein